jgi:hypothetical protein
MGTTLTGTTPQDTYDSLIKVTDNGPLSGTAKYLSDGLGNDSALALSTAGVGIGTNAPLELLHLQATSPVIQFTKTGVLNWKLGNTTGNNFIVNTDSGGGDVLTLTTTGNVGIGTSAPASPLSVGGTALYDLPASTANFSTADAGKFQLRLTSSSFNTDGNWVGLGMGYHQDYMKTAIIARASDGSARGTLNFCINTSAGSDNVTLADTRVSVTSDGLTFNGDTAAANALDDYEEGTWTMGISFGGASTGVTYTNNTGTYTKIGRKVTVNGYLLLSSKGSSTGNATITGLPFTIGDGGAYSSAASLWTRSISFLNVFQAIGTTNTTSITLWEVTTGGSLTSLDDVNFANDSDFIISLTYFV